MVDEEIRGARVSMIYKYKIKKSYILGHEGIKGNEKIGVVAKFFIGQYTNVQNHEQKGSQKYCGRRITQALELWKIFTGDLSFYIVQSFIGDRF